MLNHFTFNGKSTANFGLLVDGLKTYGAPQRRVEQIAIAGRNGDIIIDSGTYDNYVAEYTISVIDNFKFNAREIANWLLGSSGYLRLEDTYNPEHYRLASCYNTLEFDVIALSRAGTATVDFLCYPQRFLKTGEQVITLTANGSLANPTGFTAKPIIRAYSKGSFTIGNQVVTINSIDGYVDINSETMQCHKGTTNCNQNVSIDEFPTLSSGTTNITLNGVTKLDITPNWWQL